MSLKTSFEENMKLKIKKPKMYKVILHNDDYTTMEFVIEVLIDVFNKVPANAVKITFDVHKHGIGIAGIYPYDIALTKINEVEKLASKNGYPLKLTMGEV
ncbi:ATP-dependent Clp protease adaptor ClpS [Clostridium felsineum]|uniref:ATP-dependent Clp protease adaptor ClpS n=1 Tax=Clostridium felsineum TaxID=36839 RepID=UPI00098CAE8F|nr:ATP-dependent Clp protease adaptor ClpS [Clostridium felsineum]URZ16260.1 ATP-dependent Clp protease adapter protein ClpS [Clostridium felsineum DSM 794]